MTVNTVTSENAEEFYASRLPPREEPKPDETNAETKVDEESKPHDKRKAVQPRINELVGERNAARDEAEAAKAEAARVNAELEAIKKRLEVMQTVADPIEVSDRPTRTQFVTDDDYQEALTDWKADKRIAEQEERTRQAKEAALAAQMDENWKTRVAQVKADYPDYEEVVGSADIDLPTVVLNEIKASEVGALLAYELAKDNSKEARRIKGMPVAAQIRELGRMEVALMRAEPPKKTREVEKSKAPEPIESIKGTAAPIGGSREGMSYEEWRAWRSSSKK